MGPATGQGQARSEAGGGAQTVIFQVDARGQRRIGFGPAVEARDRPGLLLEAGGQAVGGDRGIAGEADVEVGALDQAPDRAFYRLAVDVCGPTPDP